MYVQQWKKMNPKIKKKLTGLEKDKNQNNFYTAEVSVQKQKRENGKKLL